MTSGDYILPSGRTPTSYWEAINSAQAEEWVMAMKEEMDALVENDTRVNVKVIDNHWVLRN